MKTTDQKGGKKGGVKALPINKQKKKKIKKLPQYIFLHYVSHVKTVIQRLKTSQVSETQFLRLNPEELCKLLLEL